MGIAYFTSSLADAKWPLLPTSERLFSLVHEGRSFSRTSLGCDAETLDRCDPGMHYTRASPKAVLAAIAACHWFEATASGFRHKVGPSMARTKRIERITRLLNLIQGDANWNAPQLAREFRTSVRTIYRDIDVLRLAGTSIVADGAANGYRLFGQRRSRPLDLSLQEVVAISAAVQAVAETDSVPYLRPALTALAKVRSALPAKLAEMLRNVDGRVVVDAAPRHVGDGADDVWQCVLHALSTRTCLRCRHANESAAIFLLKPHSLTFTDGRWGVRGENATTGQRVNLELSRFSICQQTQQNYILPRLPRPRRSRIKSENTDVPRRQKVEILLSPRSAPYFTGTCWGENQKVLWQPDGAARLTFVRVPGEGYDSLLSALFLFGPHVEIQRPAVLRQELLQQAKYWFRDASRLPAKLRGTVVSY